MKHTPATIIGLTVLDFIADIVILILIWHTIYQPDMVGDFLTHILFGLIVLMFGRVTIADLRLRLSSLLQENR